MARKKMQGAEIVIEALKEQGVTEIFGYPGGAVLPLYDAIFKQNQIRHILVRQEGGAVHWSVQQHRGGHTRQPQACGEGRRSPVPVRD